MATGKSYIKQEINLIPGDLLFAKWKKRQKFYLLLILIAVPLLCLLVYLFPEILIRRYEREILWEEEALLQMQDDRLLYQSLLEQKKQYAEMFEVYEEIDRRGICVLETLDALDSILPPEIKVDSIHLKGSKKVGLLLSTADPLQAVELLTILEETDTFLLEYYPGIPLGDREENISLTLLFNN